jgi:hypothetical protein
MKTRERELLAREAELSRREKVTESNLETIIPPLRVVLVGIIVII